MNEMDRDHLRSISERAVVVARALRESAVDARERARQMLRDDQQRRLRMRAAWPASGRSGRRGTSSRAEAGPSLNWLDPAAWEDTEAARRFRIEIDTTLPPVTTVGVHGEVDIATTAELDSALVAQLVGRCRTAPLRIDLAAVEFISVGALRGLLARVAEARCRGQQVEIVERSSAVLTLLALTGLHDEPGAAPLDPAVDWP